MRIRAFNNSDLEGGAARAAFRICDGLRTAGAELVLHVQSKKSTKDWVEPLNERLGSKADRLRGAVDRLPTRLYQRRARAPWSLNWLPNPRMKAILRLPADIMHFHWVGGGFIPINAMWRLPTPIMWTLHDMWAFTGGCHYDQGCGRFAVGCGACPQLNSSSDRDLSRMVWSRKKACWADSRLVVVGPSRWIANEARRSALFQSSRIEVIPNGIDLGVFKPLAKKSARSKLGLSDEKRIILFGAMNATGDPRKGYAFLKDALIRLGEKSQWREKLELVIFGSEGREPEVAFPFVSHVRGRIVSDDELVTLYSAADLMVAPSVQENLANTIMESLACGTPVVAFNIGGNPDMIDHKRSGYLARMGDAADLAAGMEWFLEDQSRLIAAESSAREKCEAEFSIQACARNYLNLSQSIVCDMKRD